MIILFHKNLDDDPSYKQCQIKAYFHSVVFVARATFCDRYLRSRACFQFPFLTVLNIKARTFDFLNTIVDMAKINNRIVPESRKLKFLFLLRLRLRWSIKKRKEKYKKRFWVRRIFAKREEKSKFNLLVKEMRLFEQECFFKLFRMSPKTFERLLSWVAP